MADVTVFLAIGVAPETGLQGTLAITLMPITNGYGDACLLKKLEETYEHPTAYMHFTTEPIDYESDAVKGYLTFSSVHGTGADNMTPAGLVNLNE